LSSALAVLLAVVASPAFADNPKGVTQQLSDFRSAAYQIRTQADLLDAYTNNRQISWQSHAKQLNTPPDQGNDLGKSLAKLEGAQEFATETQTMAIQHSRPHLVSIAENLTQALNLLTEDRTNIYWFEYAEAVDNISAHADHLHTKVDRILDLEASKVRLDKLELQSALTEGS